MSHELATPATAQAPVVSTGEYIVVARRYRPQTFSELVGQQHVAEALTGAIASARVGHAYLFTGARGVGKTSAARILAKALNCVTGPTATPCGVCDVCEAVSSGNDVDVLEIDGASNRGIDEIRELRQNVGIRPSRSRFKIYIIDEVHMLTRDAFNALLKTLEEPPEHVKFIFCTTEAEKIPITILSRCQRFDFAGIQSPSITERLRQIVVAEGVEADEAALEVLARRAAGSMRDSQSLLEQLLSIGQSPITLDDVHRLLGTAGDHRLGQLTQHLARRDAAAALAELDAALADGVDVGRLFDQLLGHLRDWMVAAVGGGPELLMYVSATERTAAVELARQVGIDTIIAMMQIVDTTLARLRYSTHGRLLAELAVVRICRLEDLDSVATLVEALRSGAESLALPGVTATSGVSPSSAAAPRYGAGPAQVSGSLSGGGTAEGSGPPTLKKNDPANPVLNPGLASPGRSGQPQRDASDLADSDASAVNDESAAAPAPTASPLNAQTVGQLWQRALQELSGMTGANAEMCKSATFVEPNRLVLTFARRYTSCKQFCERSDQLAQLEAVMRGLTGTPVRVELVLSNEPDEEPPATEVRRPAASGRERLNERSQHPLAKRAAELFDARPVRLDEPTAQNRASGG